MTSRTLLATSLAALLGIGLLAQTTQAQEAFQNLQVLPKTISKADLKKIMKAQNKALGVDCSFCHVEPDMAKDIGHKKIAREMMRMTEEINKKYPTLKGNMTCMTCHRGKAEPDAK